MNQTQRKQKMQMLIGDDIVSSESIIKHLRKQTTIPALVQELILERELSNIRLPEERNDEILNKYLEQHNIKDKTAFEAHLKDRLIDEEILLELLTRPEKIVLYREKRWGPVAESIYLQKKEKYDYVTYHRLENENLEVMQEIYFRIKGKEESWDQLARQFPGSNAYTTSVKGPVSTTKVEEEILQSLRQGSIGKINKPIQLKNKTVLVELIEFQSSSYDSKMKELLLRDTFDEWLRNECRKLINEIEFKSK